MSPVFTPIWFAFVLALVYGCAFDVIRVEQVPTNFSPTPTCTNSFILTKTVGIQLSGGYSRTLKKGTRWSCIGRITEGFVYKTKDQILTVEASNIYEANIVVSSGRLVGFYLPVEGTFSPVRKSIQLVPD